MEVELNMPLSARIEGLHHPLAAALASELHNLGLQLVSSQAGSVVDARLTPLTALSDYSYTFLCLGEAELWDPETYFRQLISHPGLANSKIICLSPCVSLAAGDSQSGIAPDIFFRHQHHFFDSVLKFSQAQKLDCRLMYLKHSELLFTWHTWLTRYHLLLKSLPAHLAFTGSQTETIGLLAPESAGALVKQAFSRPIYPPVYLVEAGALFTWSSMALKIRNVLAASQNLSAPITASSASLVDPNLPTGLQPLVLPSPLSDVELLHLLSPLLAAHPAPSPPPAVSVASSSPKTSPPRQVKAKARRVSRSHPRHRPKVPSATLILVGLLLVLGVFLAPLLSFLWLVRMPPASLDASEVYLNRLNQAYYTNIGYFRTILPEFLLTATRVENFLEREYLTTRYRLDYHRSYQVLASILDRINESGKGNIYPDMVKVGAFANSAYTLNHQLAKFSSVPQSSSLDLPVEASELQQLSQISQIFPSLLSPTGPTRIAVVLQNNLELRPSGGFIHAVYLLHFDQGKLLTTESFDVYQLDSLLRGQVAPPASFTDRLDESNWYLRDANWHPDFEVAGKQIAWFLEKETNKRPDMVIAVNLLAIKNVLSVLPDTSLKNGVSVNYQNLLETAFRFQDVSYNPNSQTKNTLFIPLIEAITQIYQQSSPEMKTKILSQWLRSLSEKQVLVYSDHAPVMAQINAVGLAQKLTGQSDFLAVSEANVGVNRANYYVFRDQEHQLRAATGRIEHVHRLAITNRSPNDEWPAGPYQAFVRLLLPANAKVEKVEVDQVNIDPVPLAAAEQAEYGRLTVVPLDIDIDPGSTGVVTISYSVPRPDAKTYQWRWFKQSGTAADPVVIKTQNFSRPETLSVFGADGVVVPGEVQATLNSDLLLQVEFD